MAMSMNIHGVAGINLTDIKALTLPDGTVFYTRSISVTGKDGKELIRLDPMSDDGYKLLVSDDELASLLKAA